MVIKQWVAHKRGLNTKVHMAVDANGMPVNVIITSGTTADCTPATDLIEEIEAEALIANRTDDTNEIIDFSQTKRMKRVIPSKNIKPCSYNTLQNF